MLEGYTMKADSIIFDIDGTIWDTTEVVAAAWNAGFEAKGAEIHVSAVRLKSLFGMPLLDITKILLFENNISFTEEYAQEVLESLTDYELEYLGKYGAPVYDGLEETLSNLSEKYPLAVVSNCQAGYAELMLEKTGLRRYFEFTLCPDDTGKLKAENIIIAAKRMTSVCPVYVGDTAMDQAACKECGVSFIHAAYGFGTAEDPDAVINTPKELLELL